MRDRADPGSPNTWPETPMLQDSTGWVELEEHRWDALAAMSEAVAALYRSRAMPDPG